MKCTERKVAGYMIINIITIILILECIYPGLARGLIQIMCLFSWIALITGFIIEFSIWKEQEAINIRKRCRHGFNRTGGRPVMGQNRNGQNRGQRQRPNIANRPPRTDDNRDMSESSHNSAEISLNDNRVNREMHSNTTATQIERICDKTEDVDPIICTIKSENNQSAPSTDSKCNFKTCPNSQKPGQSIQVSGQTTQKHG